MLRPNAQLPLGLLADVFVPDFGVVADEAAKEVFAFVGVEVDHLDAVFAQPIDAAAKCFALADDDAREAELADKARAIPAGRERGGHGHAAIAALASGVAEGVGFAMGAGVAVLHAAVVAGSEQLSIGREDGGADGDAAFSQPFAGLGDRGGEHLLWGAYLGHRDRVKQRNSVLTHCPTFR